MDKEYLQKFAKHVKSLRKAKKLTQDDFDSPRISRSMYSHVELATSDITLSKVKAIADRLGVHPKDLLDFD
ncbi:TPA: helix-turn-helix transcriptional regulator [Candidatus Galligastranaerophilus faecipullorum]|nr:helix-turn-helix transcriptional regulator [Candidatus Galligastranaerophilus faecipullorum]